MWTRQELKHRGKKAFFSSYWKYVLVSLVLAIVAGSAAGGASSGVSSGLSNMANAFRHDVIDLDLDDLDVGDEITINGHEIVIDQEFLDKYVTEDEEGGLFLDKDALEEFSIDPENATITVGDNSYEIDKPTAATIGIVVAIVFIVISIIMCIIGIVGICIDIFVYNPIEYGCQKFFKKSLDENTSLTTMFHGFKDGYGRIVKVMFFRDLFIFLWSLLFVIPGIVKSYAYRLVPYILAENPGISKDEALKESNRLMMGNKWRVFVLDLSFLGWNILSVMTLGILGIFYVSPYMNGTNAALYEALKEEKGSNVCLTES